MILSRREEIIAGLVDGDLMLLNIETGHYHQVNPTGRRIWELLEQPRTLDEICAALGDEFNVSPQDCLAQTRAFIQELVQRNIIEEKKS
jgi:PqqD family protein of HPr-rel-A system